MAINSAFSLNGATPQGMLDTYRTNNPLNSTGSPVARALQGARSAPSAPAPQTPAPTASTPLKKTTTNNVDGSSVTHEYHAPTQPGMMSNGQPPPPNNDTKVNIDYGAPSYAPGQNPFQGSIGGLINFGGKTNPTAATSAKTLTQQSQGQNPASPQINTLQNIAEGGSSELRRAKEDVSGLIQEQSLIAHNPNMASEVASGRASSITPLITAAQTGVQNTLAGQSQQITAANEAGGLGLTGQGQKITAANEAGNLGLTGQGQNISALGTAGGLVPEALRYGVGGNTGGALNPLNNVDSIARQVVSGEISPSQAYSMGGSITNWQGVINDAIQKANPGFNTATAEGRYAARQSNTQTQGTANVNAGATGVGQSTTALNDLKLNVNNVEGLGKLLVSTANGNQINPLRFAPANQVVNDFMKTLSDEGRTRFQSSLKAFAGAASQLLTNSSGLTPTGVTDAVKAIADGSIQIGALRGLVDQAQIEGHVKLGNQVSQYINYQALTKGQQPPNLPGTMTAGGQNYVLSEDGTYNLAQ